VHAEDDRRDSSSSRISKKAPGKMSVLMHPVVFVTASTLVGTLFAAQEWMNLRHMDYKGIHASDVFESWGVQYFMWGVICWVLWRLFRPFIEEASLSRMVTIVVPISVVTCLLEEMIWVLFFPHYPLNHASMPYWTRVAFNFKGDLAESMAIFWSSFFFFRGAGYYQKLREKETIAAQLEVQLANAKIEALRMQLNPHFLFNTMNSISSLMRVDIEAADSLLEQLSSLLRMTLERRDVQLIPLHDEIEFTETYLAMQDRRYAGRVTRAVSVDPDLHDALVPAMILQPIVENAYVHGLSKLDRGGELSIEVSKHGRDVRALITNSGLGLNGYTEGKSNGYGVGLTNIKNRLRLHYGEACAFSMRQLDRTHVQVAIEIPLQLSAREEESVTRFGA
jgi:two-component system, LytTR family, sensor kinase